MHSVMETESFARQAELVGLSDDERLEIATLLSNEPKLGVLIKGTGGARKFRFQKPHSGKSSGYRIISYFAADDVPVFLLDVLDKGDRLNLSQAERNDLRKALGRIADDYRKATKDRVRQLSEIAS